MSEESGQSDCESQEENEKFEETERRREKIAKFEELVRRKEGYDNFIFLTGGIPISEEHAEYQKEKSAQGSRNHKAKAKSQGIKTPRAGPSQPRQRNDTPPNDSSELPYKWGQVFDQTNASSRDVRVYEDTGTVYNFIAPSIVDACNLTPYKTRPVPFESIAGGVAFIAHECVEPRWLGRDMKQGIDIFYIAPKTTTIELLVGRGFLAKHPDVFMRDKPTKSAFVTVPKRMTNGEKLKMEANAIAKKAKSDKLEKMKREKEGSASSSKSGSSSGKKSG